MTTPAPNRRRAIWFAAVGVVLVAGATVHYVPDPAKQRLICLEPR